MTPESVNDVLANDVQVTRIDKGEKRREKGFDIFFGT